MKKTNKKNKRITNYQKNRVYRNLIELEKTDNYIDYDLNMSELFEMSRKEKQFKSYKNNGLICFFNTIYDNDKSKMIFMVLEYPLEDKDSIKLNENIVKNIDFLESSLIELDKVEIQRSEYNEQNKYFVFIKAIKKMDKILENILNNFKLTSISEKGEKNDC